MEGYLSTKSSNTKFMAVSKRWLHNAVAQFNGTVAGDILFSQVTPTAGDWGQEDRLHCVFGWEEPWGGEPGGVMILFTEISFFHVINNFYVF